MTMIYTNDEYDFLLRIGNLTRYSISYLFAIAIEFFGDKLIEKVKKSKRAFTYIKKLLTMTLKQNFNHHYSNFGIYRGVFLKNSWHFNYFSYFEM
jgi:hypothetical protein